MSKVGGLGVQKVGLSDIHSEYIRHRLLRQIFNFGGAPAPLSKSGGSSPLCPPGSLPLITNIILSPTQICIMKHMITCTDVNMSITVTACTHTGQSRQRERE